MGGNSTSQMGEYGYLIGFEQFRLQGFRLKTSSPRLRDTETHSLKHGTDQHRALYGDYMGIIKGYIGIMENEMETTKGLRFRDIIPTKC